MSESKVIIVGDGTEKIIAVSDFRVLKIMRTIARKDIPTKYAFDHLFIEPDGSVFATDGKCIAWYDKFFAPSDRRRFLLPAKPCNDDIWPIFIDRKIEDERFPKDWREKYCATHVPILLPGYYGFPIGIDAFKLARRVHKITQKHLYWYPVKNNMSELAHPIKGLYIQHMGLATAAVTCNIVGWDNVSDTLRSHWWWNEYRELEAKP